MIFTAKSVFFSLNVNLRGLIMLSACTVSRFPWFLLVSRVWDTSSGIGPCFPSARRLCKLDAKAEENDKYSANHKQQANPLLSMHNYNPVVISK
jgi:hypothetical protein